MKPSTRVWRASSPHSCIRLTRFPSLPTPTRSEEAPALIPSLWSHSRSNLVQLLPLSFANNGLVPMLFCRWLLLRGRSGTEIIFVAWVQFYKQCFSISNDWSWFWCHLVIMYKVLSNVTENITVITYLIWL